eukprot:jgi/Ulvmu1/12000/UM083_0013.1
MITGRNYADSVPQDRFETIEAVQEALRKAGLESSELIICVDFTKSNESNGKCFGGQSLHSLSSGTNPYTTVLSVICQTLSAFDDDQMISAYGFGDVSSRDKALFSFAPEDQQIHSLPNLLQAYAHMVPHVQLSGPTSFAPAINKALDVVRQSGGRFHILILIADGQVVPGQCMEKTKRAIVEASRYPLSIIMVGVGDGPWETMQKFDSELPTRAWDNFQFCCFTEIAAKAELQKWSADRMEAAFALSALMEVPDQYATIVKRGLLGTVPESPPPQIQVGEPPSASITVIPGSAPLC